MTGTDLHTVSGAIPTVEGSLPAEETEDRFGAESGVRSSEGRSGPAPRSEGRSGPAPRSEGRSGPAPRSEGPTDRLIEVLVALSGHLDIEERDDLPAAAIDVVQTHATLERLAVLGMSFGF